MYPRFPIPPEAATDPPPLSLPPQIAEAEEEERGPLPPGPVSLSAWYNASVMLRPTHPAPLRRSPPPPASIQGDPQAIPGRPGNSPPGD